MKKAQNVVGFIIPAAVKTDLAMLDKCTKDLKFRLREVGVIYHEIVRKWDNNQRYFRAYYPDVPLNLWHRIELYGAYEVPYEIFTVDVAVVNRLYAMHEDYNKIQAAIRGVTILDGSGKTYVKSILQLSLSELQQVISPDGQVRTAKEQKAWRVERIFKHDCKCNPQRDLKYCAEHRAQYDIDKSEAKLLIRTTGYITKSEVKKIAKSM